MNKHTKPFLSFLLAVMFSVLIIAQGSCQDDPNRNMNGPLYTTSNPFYNAGYRGQCTWYAWGRAAETGWRIDSLGNANTWYSACTSAGSKSMTPQVGDVMCLSLGTNGHVACVVQVNSATSWIVEEYNIKSLAWTRETVTRSSAGATTVTGTLFGATTLQGFLHSPISGGTATDYYVNGAMGSDGNAGTSGSPFATVTKAVSMASDTAPTVIHVKGGRYITRNYTIHKNIRIVNDGGGTVYMGK